LVGMECNYWASVAYASRHFSCLAGGLRNYDGGIDVDRQEGIFFNQQGLQLKMTRAVLSYFHDTIFPQLVRIACLILATSIIFTQSVTLQILLCKFWCSHSGTD
jgi:hypothetical protein